MTAPIAEPPHPAEMVGAVEGIDLSKGPTTATVPIHPATGPASAAFAAGAPRHTYLNLENVVGEGPLGIYAVYLNIPQDADPHRHKARFAGTLPMFGVAEASRPDSEHAGQGVTYVLDVTKLVDDLKASHEWDPQNLRVTFAPVGQHHPDGKVRVGRVSVFYR
jgi:tyrosinase